MWEERLKGKSVSLTRNVLKGISLVPGGSAGTPRRSGEVMVDAVEGTRQGTSAAG